MHGATMKVSMPLLLIAICIVNVHLMSAVGDFHLKKYIYIGVWYTVLPLRALYVRA